MTRSSQIVTRYTGPTKIARMDNFKTRAAQRAASKRKLQMIASNVGELVAILKTLDQSARIYTIEPPFDGVKVVDCENGSFLIGRPREPESKSAGRS